MGIVLYSLIKIPFGVGYRRDFYKYRHFLILMFITELPFLIYNTLIYAKCQYFFAYM